MNERTSDIGTVASSPVFLFMDWPDPPDGVRVKPANHARPQNKLNGGCSFYLSQLEDLSSFEAASASAL